MSRSIDGADYWINRRVGIRLEVRDHLHAERGGTTHLWGPRIGVVWRGR